MYVITAYAPTLPVSEDNPGVRDRFYAEMEAELRRMGSKAYTFVCGNWNAVVGHRGGGGGGALAFETLRTKAIELEVMDGCHNIFGLPSNIVHHCTV